MSNSGKLEIVISNVEAQPAQDPKTRVQVHRKDNTVIREFENLSLPLPGLLELPAFPQESNLRCSILPKRYRPFSTSFFTLSTAAPKQLTAETLRDPQQWRAQFTDWAQLPGEFAELQQVLEGSQIKVIKGESLGKFTGSKYDSAKTEPTILAKTALLNLYVKLTILKEPIGGQHSWFSFVRQLLALDRERFYALVDPEMGEIVRQVSANLPGFPFYNKATATNHFAKLQETLPEFRINKAKMLSLKTREANGNLQLTLAPAKDAAGNEVLLLDADLDENGKLLQHLADVLFLHPIKGGTHPFDIHEYLRLAYGRRDLGYVLV